jgi:uncharacterized protein YpiB (UPF0302 family)
MPYFLGKKNPTKFWNFYLGNHKKKCVVSYIPFADEKNGTKKTISIAKSTYPNKPKIFF